MANDQPCTKCGGKRVIERVTFDEKGNTVIVVETCDACGGTGLA